MSRDPVHADAVGRNRRACGLAALALACAALMLAGPQRAAAFACGAPPSAYIDGKRGGFTDFSDSSGFPIFNKEHCYGNPIFSTNGKDTYTSNPYGNRAMTNSGFGYQCTEFPQRYWGFKFNKWLVVPSAADLCTTPLPRGVRRFRPGQGMPVPGDIFVFGRGMCGASSEHGHVSVVTRVFNESAIQIAQQNMRSERYTIATVKVSCGCGFLHAEDNLMANGPRMDTPADAWDPDNYPAEDGPMHTGGGSMISAPANLCQCKSDDPQSVWPLCCKLPR